MHVPKRTRHGTGKAERFVVCPRILRGTKPSELPVKVQLTINLKAAKALGLTIPESFLVRADDVIQ
jgi:ABC-type uncharacterized transport system substrate-binding protein